MAISETPPGTSKWYDTERNTEALVKAVMAARPVHGLSADDVWWLLQLTWINVSKGHPTKGHWKKLKVPALAHLFKKEGSISDDLDSTLANMQLSHPIVEAAVKETGFVNAYPAYRKSLLGWCSENGKQLRAILTAAENLKPNDQGRFDLASNRAIAGRANSDREAQDGCRKSHHSIGRLPRSQEHVSNHQWGEGCHSSIGQVEPG